jgi:hypothetical protein
VQVVVVECGDSFIMKFKEEKKGRSNMPQRAKYKNE